MMRRPGPGRPFPQKTSQRPVSGLAGPIEGWSKHLHSGGFDQDLVPQATTLAAGRNGGALSGIAINRVGVAAGAAVRWIV